MILPVIQYTGKSPENFESYQATVVKQFSLLYLNALFGQHQGWMNERHNEDVVKVYTYQDTEDLSRLWQRRDIVALKRFVSNGFAEQSNVVYAKRTGNVVNWCGLRGYNIGIDTSPRLSIYGIAVLERY